MAPRKLAAISGDTNTRAIKINLQPGVTDHLKKGDTLQVNHSHLVKGDKLHVNSWPAQQ